MTHRQSLESNAITIEPGVTLGDVKEKADLHQALVVLERDIAEIKAQIEGAMGVDFRTGNQTVRDPTWLRRTEAALRLKKHALGVVRYRLSILKQTKKAEGLAAGEAHQPSIAELRAKRADLILDIIKDELGADEFVRLVTLAKLAKPELFPGHEVERSQGELGVEQGGVR